MDRTKSSVIKTNPKPVSVFYVWYSELCRRLNIRPSPFVRPAKPKSQTVLDFRADRLKVEEWSPIVNALRQDTSLHVIAIRSRIANCQFLHEIDTEDKARNMKRKYGTIWTAYVLKQLLKSVSYSLKNTSVLTYLELDGLPLFKPYLESLLQALKKNQTLKILSLSNCAIQDSGCSLVCSYLRFTPNIEVLNLSGCDLTPMSGEHISKLIKYQQINRYCETWQNSLRYENPDVGKMRGIKRITLNCNPLLNDIGLNYILNELADDLWLKALDLQKCGLTENISDKVISVVECNTALEILDVRQNDLLNISTMDRILQLLKQRQPTTEFQWCSTAATLTWSSAHSSDSKSTFATGQNVHQTRSAPMKNCPKLTAASKIVPARKAKTVDRLHKDDTSRLVSLSNTKQQLQDLNDKLNREIRKRKEVEKINHELQNAINQIRFGGQLNGKKVPHKANGINKDISKSVIREKSQNQIQSSLVTMRRKVEPQSHVNGYIKNMYKNGISKNMENNAYSILEKILNNGLNVEDHVRQESDINNKSSPKAVNDESLSTSQTSLYRYMEELKLTNT